MKKQFYFNHASHLKLKFFSHKSSKESDLEAATNIFYCLGPETWLNNSWKFISRNQSRFWNFFDEGKFKNV